MTSDFWLFFGGALNTEWCDGLVERALTHYEPQDATIGFERDIADETYRKCDIRWLGTEIEPDLVNTIWHFANWANRESFDVATRYVTDLQFTTYNGSEDTPSLYDWHHDVNWVEPKPYHRKLSMVMLLSDPSEYEGGVFEFDPTLPQLPEEAQEKGTVIVFPSFHRHRVTPVTSGTRHSLVTWVEGPRWR